jgi:hypothetical protein
VAQSQDIIRDRIVAAEEKRAKTPSSANEEDRDMRGLVDALQSTQIATKSISYKDVAGSFRKYKGDNSQDVNV